MNNFITGGPLLDHQTSRSLKKLLFFAFSLIFFSNYAFAQSAKLDTQEVRVMREIWGKLGLLVKKEWDFDKDPCGDEGSWRSFAICDCSFDSNTTCSVTEIIIASQNVSAPLPSEFSKLPYLQFLDLSFNYFTGIIPSEWATMSLRNLSLMGNQLSGPFPTVLTRITTLIELSIEGNFFSGPIPEEIANLNNLEKLRICDNSFTGKIPNFISQWTKIGRLHIQGCSFEGPFPSRISVLTKLKDLRISDLKGGASSFPSLQKIIGLRILILRSCLIHGTIPNYFRDMIYLNTIDLSFNNLTGDIPSSFSELEIERVYVNSLQQPFLVFY